MCSPTETISLLLFVAFAAIAIHGGVLQKKFAQGLRALAPAVWDDIATWHRWNDNSDLHESAVASYILQGCFWSLQDKDLMRQALRCRRAYFIAFVVLALMGIHSSLTNVFAPVACLWGGAG